MPQTILHKAFKGELTEQLETDGDAKVLLEEIVALKSEGKSGKVIYKKYVQPDDEVLRIVAESATMDYLVRQWRKPLLGTINVLNCGFLNKVLRQEEP
ncbi:hypothetical protein MQX03_07685 [Chryseobacterium aahli]|uniref:hypothetical protein n=1 Tax=Chryseobacterium aahli TaxID=1278643 RepID=UPI001F61A336|nr:hypothetical protein [Chryseobacterium aahli]MCI3937076.1 hypothetical protein [Chryseobacterium aahli]